MTWKSHKLLSFSICYFLTGSIILSFFTATGSIVPDLLEGRESVNNKKLHRTITHWITPFLIIVTVLLLILAEKGLFCSNFLSDDFVAEAMIAIISGGHANARNHSFADLLLISLFFVNAGCILHILQDAVTGRVPGIRSPFKKRLGKRIFRTGSYFEYVFSVIVSSLLLTAKFLTW